MEEERFKRILNRERQARKEAERLLERKSLELYELNQSLEKKVDERTAALEAALKQAEEALKSKDVFLSNMSHEIRTPLNAIIGFVDILKVSQLDEEKQKKYLNIIATSSQNLLAIINDILDLTKIMSGKFTLHPEEVHLKQFISNSFTLFKQKANEKNINYALDYDETLAQNVRLDTTRVTQIISNFLSNAIKFTPESKNVTLECRHDNHNLIVKVIDTGIGIADDAQEKVFQSFEQANSSTTKEYGGTGLGLSIAKSLIELHGGSLIFSSQEGTGSTFGFSIPLEVVESTVVEEIAVTHNSFESKKRVLVVDDVEVNRLLIQVILDQFELEYDSATNGDEAVEAMKSSDYSLVLMDYDMPKKDGVQATLEIREFDTITPIVGLSAAVFKSDTDRFIEAGMNEMLMKPIEMDKLTLLLEKYLKE